MRVGQQQEIVGEDEAMQGTEREGKCRESMNCGAGRVSRGIQPVGGCWRRHGNMKWERGGEESKEGTGCQCIVT
jgi:hypothetical protein